jgi:hypothetical protein
MTDAPKPVVAETTPTPIVAENKASVSEIKPAPVGPAPAAAPVAEVTVAKK